VEHKSLASKSAICFVFCSS